MQYVSQTGCSPVEFEGITMNGTVLTDDETRRFS